MRFIVLALLISCFSYGQDITTVHFNYKWNERNSYKGLDRLRNTKVQYAFVEDQSDNIKKSIKSVPLVGFQFTNVQPSRTSNKVSIDPSNKSHFYEKCTFSVKFDLFYGYCNRNVCPSVRPSVNIACKHYNLINFIRFSLNLV